MTFVGAGIVIALVLTAFLAPFLSKYPPNEIGQGMMETPSPEHPFGTDTLGRDIFSRTLWGGRSSLLVASVAMVTGLSIGTVVGCVSGFFGGKIDTLIVPAMDAFYAFPSYILALIMAIMLTPDAANIAFAVGISYIPQYFRVVRSITLSLKEKMFIEAERSIGASNFFIIRHHILPYTISSLTVLVSMGVADSILAVSGLGFLGIGIQPPTPEWGTDMRWGRDIFLIGKWWVLLYPGIMILLAVIGFNLLSEGLNTLFQERGAGRFAA